MGATSGSTACAEGNSKYMGPPYQHQQANTDTQNNKETGDSGKRCPENQPEDYAPTNLDPQGCGSHPLEKNLCLRLGHGGTPPHPNKEHTHTQMRVRANYINTNRGQLETQGANLLAPALMCAGRAFFPPLSNILILDM